MVRLLGSSIACLFAALPAVRADEVRPNWSGFYVGLSLGGAWGDNTATAVCDEASQAFVPRICSGGGIVVGLPPADHAFDSAGAVGGALAGFNVQEGNLVFGLEADVSRTSVRGKVSTLTTPAVGLADSTVSESVEWLSTVRGRVGVTAGDVLVYGTAGLAFGDIRHEYSLKIPAYDNFSAGDSNSEWATGWTAGSGVELLIGKLSLRTEYLYFDFGDEELKAEWSTNALPVTGVYSRVDFGKLNGHIARVGVSYRID